MKKMKFLLWFLILPLMAGMILTGCKDDDEEDDQPQVDFTVLDEKIQEAQDLHDNAVEGNEIGNYQPGAKAELQAAIDLAQDVRNTAGVTQAQVDAAIVNLEAAIVAFEAKKITDVAPGSLVAQWLFNGDATDNAPGARAGHDGIVSAGHPNWGGGTPMLAEDRHGNADYCYYFYDGGNIVVPADPALNPPDMTLSFWLKLEETWAHNYFMSNDIWHAWKLQVQDANKIFFTRHVMRDGEEAYIDRDTDATTLELNTWYHGAVTFTSGELVFYVDGVEVARWEGAEIEGTPIDPHDGIDFCIGQALPTEDFSDDPEDPHAWKEWTGHFKGWLDDIRIYNTVLTAPQIQIIYNYEKDNTVEAEN